ncbi:U3 small nucleolar RNA-associated protein 6-domain-containing protein, partial [Lineolata rhizophorae]
MASVSDAARFSLETSAPELNELLNKKIFNREQINKIARARSDFEHHINAPGTGLDKWNRYIKYETTFLKLRRERARKMGVKGLNHAGAGRVFRVFDGAVRKFPGNVDLWLDYVKFAEHEKAFSRVAEILTRALRLLAGESKLWIYAGRYAYGTHRDINQARQFLQRGLRFNSKDLDLWLTYLELEMKYLDSIWARQELLSGGIGGAPEPSSRDGPELDKIQLPVGPMATSNVLTKALDATKVGPYDTNSVTLDPSTAPPIVNGAIPEAVFRGIMTAF